MQVHARTNGQRPCRLSDFIVGHETPRTDDPIDDAVKSFRGYRASVACNMLTRLETMEARADSWGPSCAD
jgi:hypothetical protein